MLHAYCDPTTTSDSNAMKQMVRDCMYAPLQNL